MIKTLLLPITGGECDETSLSTAIAVARLFDAHIESLYAGIDPAAVLVAAGALDAEAGSGTMALLEELERQEKERATRASQFFRQFCDREHIAIVDSPPGPGTISAAWREHTGDQINLLMDRARFNDLLVLGSGKDIESLLPEEIGGLLIGSRRPVLLAPSRPPANLAGTVVIAWKNTPEAARAVTAAMPFLSKATKILVLAVDEGGAGGDQSLEAILGYLRWHGLHAMGQHVAPGTRSGAEALLSATLAAEADLLVMGGYGHSRMRETIFGGFTRHMLAGRRLPVLMIH